MAKGYNTQYVLQFENFFGFQAYCLLLDYDLLHFCQQFRLLNRRYIAENNNRKKNDYEGNRSIRHR